MNILYTITAYPPSIGGAQLLAHNLAKKMSQKNTVQVISLWDRFRTDWLLGTTLFAENDDKKYVVDKVPVHRLGFSFREKNRLLIPVLYYYLSMKKAITQISPPIETKISHYVNKVDVINNFRIGREPISYASFHAARKAGKPFFFTPVHHPAWKGWRYQAYIDLYRMADGIIALTEAEKKVLSSFGVDERNIFVTGMGPILSCEWETNKIQKDHHIEGPTVLFLGQHYFYKGFSHLLEAAQLVWKEIPEAHFVFMGPGQKKMERIFNRYNDRRIHKLGQVDLVTKTSALAACSLLCVPSTQESFGGVYTEAWSFGKPVIGCNIPAVAEVIEDGINGFLVNQNSSDIANKIIELLKDPSAADHMGMAGKRKVETRYNWDKIAELTSSAYLTKLGT
jgi:glycosyltransferase involved in cell wall biosynthesis